MPLKIKIFMWYLLKVVVLTKDNLSRRNWYGSLKCCFCMRNETIQYLFVECHYAKFLWRALQFNVGLYTPHSISYIFENWLVGVIKNLPNLFLLEHPLYVGLYGCVEMIWFLIKHHLCSIILYAYSFQSNILAPVLSSTTKVWWRNQVSESYTS
jgi:hypothetical protein